MPRLFISYRREDTDFAAHAIYEKLKARFGEDSVFIDVDSIPPGVDFREHIRSWVARCDVLLALIGREWLQSVDAQGRSRLHDPRDFVRIEVEAALERDIPLVPVLVGNVTMPRPGDLPEPLVDLCFRNAVHIRSGREMAVELERLVVSLNATLDAALGTRPAVAGELVSNSLGMEERLVPAGEYRMGSLPSETGSAEDEQPQHLVRITHPFYLGVHAVTQGEYERLSGDNPSKYTGNPRRPVETVALADAAGYLNALSRRENLPPCYALEGRNVRWIGGPGYRLPTEAEWEYACRGGTESAWSWGDDETRADAHAWFLANADGRTQAVGAKQPNPIGLHDLHGNVWELCWDWMGPYPRAAAVDPSGPAAGQERVLRGGCFADPPWAIRSAYRSSIRVAVRSGRVGFRVARSTR